MESTASGFPCVAASTTFILIPFGVKNGFRPASLTLHLRTPIISYAITLPVWGYTDFMERYLGTIQPQLSDTWRADEMFLK